MTPGREDREKMPRSGTAGRPSWPTSHRQDRRPRAASSSAWTASTRCRQPDGTPSSRWPTNNRIDHDGRPRARFCTTRAYEPGMPFYNCAPGQEGLRPRDRRLFTPYCGRAPTIDLLDRLKEIGLQAVDAGRVCPSASPTCASRQARSRPARRVAEEGRPRPEELRAAASSPSRERYNQLLDIWSHCREEVHQEADEDAQGRPPRRERQRGAADSKEGKIYLNPVYLMSDSGACGNVSQMQQLAGHARSDGQALGRDHRDPHPRQLPRRPQHPRVLLAHPRRLARVWPTPPQDRRLGLPHPQAVRRAAERDHQRVSTGGPSRGVAERAIYKGEKIDVPCK